MAIDYNDLDERQARLDAMIEEFRGAQQRRLVNRGTVLWKRTEAAQQAIRLPEPQLPDKLH